jgi:hypothetical protein
MHEKLNLPRQMKYKKESKLANIGCFTIVVLTILFFLLIPKNKRITDSDFEIVSSYEPTQNSKVYCVYTEAENFEKIRRHAKKLQAKTTGSIAIYYYDDKKLVPDFSDSGYIISDKAHQNAIASYEKYGKKQEKFLIK